MVKRVEESAKSKRFFVTKKIRAYALTRKGADLRRVYYDEKLVTIDFNEERVNK
jgi:hypothetical protein